MEAGGFSLTAARQEALYEAIKAKHRNILSYFTNQDNSLLLEIAEMILLLSAQLAQLEGHQGVAPREDEAKGRTAPSPATAGEKFREYSDSLGLFEKV